MLSTMTIRWPGWAAAGTVTVGVALLAPTAAEPTNATGLDVPPPPTSSDCVSEFDAPDPSVTFNVTGYVPAAAYV